MTLRACIAVYLGVLVVFGFRRLPLQSCSIGCPPAACRMFRTKLLA